LIGIQGSERRRTERDVSPANCDTRHSLSITGGIMRATEFMHFMNRTDIGLGANPKERDYTHYTPRMYAKRRRYEYQKMLRSKDADNNKK